jgi:beta-N-acetylhexosaminidase
MTGYRSLAIVLAFVVIGSGPGPVAPATAALASTQPCATPTTTESTDRPVSRAARPTLAQMVGQKLVIVMAGRKPDANLLGRVRRGEIGGIVLLGSNIKTRSALISLTGKLQAAAAAGGQPRLMIAVDQEGGFVKRVSWAPPRITVPEMGRIGSSSVARAQGAKTGAALRGLGINVDFAPVADVPRSTASFMYQQGRTFSFDPALTARLADAFAAGLASEGVLATMKHFPGIGFAKKNTDLFVDTIKASRAALVPDLRPYRKAIGHDIGLIMLSNATYTAYDPGNAAGWSSAIAVTLLRHDLGFNGVTITDSLSGTAHARGLTVKALALRAAIAGTDMILMTGSEKTSRNLYATLLGDARGGSIPRATLRASYDRILALKAGF